MDHQGYYVPRWSIAIRTALLDRRRLRLLHDVRILHLRAWVIIAWSRIHGDVCAWADSSHDRACFLSRNEGLFWLYRSDRRLYILSCSLRSIRKTSHILFLHSAIDSFDPSVVFNSR